MLQIVEDILKTLTYNELYTTPSAAQYALRA